MKFAISSHYKYYDKIKEVLHKSLLESGIKRDDIYCFVASPEVKDYIQIDDTTWHINHNSFDFNAIVSVIELNLIEDRWFFMHDTCRVGHSFARILNEYDHQGKEAVALVNNSTPNMNMGSMSWSAIEAIKSRAINDYKNPSFDSNQSNLFKTKLVLNEGEIFRSSPHSYCNRVIRTNDSDTIYGGEQRVVEYYPDLDFYKYKANWHMKKDWTLSL